MQSASKDGNPWTSQLMLLFRGTRFVLRKKPAGQLLSPTAHRVEREYEMLSALHKYNMKPSTPLDKKIPIPEPILLCEDSSIIGTPFYIMEFLEGRIFTDMRMPELPPKDKREWYYLYVHNHAYSYSLVQLACCRQDTCCTRAGYTRRNWSVCFRCFY